ncbi:PIG-L deacetylase family protein [Archangium primigenium]|uniref:PIG-L deacetylase family protein n=1 Tax=[Archangium] primigenium TaxID=2792470 RepID=UPI00195A93EA|nr:PIG-L family deacetylase [Archangium primigenium]MBM7113569.1 PIG-L family deacetylase [Archangium primigenium]
MSTALFLSPHLDDVAFSCGGTLARLKDQGWTVALVTCFTRSVPHPTGFALECQTSKGIAPEVDYMALRREEDRDFATLMGVDRLVWGDLPEAPHRGYVRETLFTPPRREDAIEGPLVDMLAPLMKELRPDLVFVPQALGSHVDHVQLVRALPSLGLEPGRTLWYRDTPYAVRQPHAEPDDSVPSGLKPLAVNVTAELPRKVAGCNHYRTQVDFQFGGSRAVAPTLDAFHRREAMAQGRSGCAEVFLSTDRLPPDVWSALQ